MKQPTRLLLLTLSLILIMVVSLFNTGIAFADEGTPPSTEEPVQPPQEEALPEAEPSVAEIIEALPPETELVVLDNEGEALPLASQEAADVILSDPDPMWCPAGQTPGTDVLLDGIQDCTDPFNRFTTASGLINTLQGGSYGGPGTIYVSSGNIAGADQGKNITLNGTSLTALSSSDLTIQGGWDFGSDSVNNRSVFVNSTLEIKNWTGNITVNDLKFELASGIGGDGLTIKSITGNVTVNNVVITDSNEDDGLFVNNIDGSVNVNDSKFNDNAGNGATIQNVTNDVTVTGSEFRRNDKGLEVSNVDTITLNDVLAQNNDLQGADLSADESITVYGGSSFNKNSRQGLKADAYTVNISDSEAIDNGTDGTDRSGFRADGYDVVLTNVYAASNGLFGANIHTGNSATISGSLFEYNTGSGLHVLSDGEIILNAVTASNNGGDGAYLDNSCGCTTNNIFISSSTFDFNGGASGVGRGLIAYSYGDIKLTDVTASMNAGGGAELDNTYGSGGITLTGTNSFTYNGFGLTPSVGLWTISNSDITLSGVTATGNGYGAGGGAFISSSAGGITITDSTFSNNCILCDTGVGFVAMAGGGDVTLNGVTANDNGNDPFYGYPGPADAIGAFIFNLGGNTFVKNSSFSGNCTLGDCFGGGIQIISLGNVYFDHVTVNGNGTDQGGVGAVIDAGANVDIYCSTFSNNFDLGIGAFMSGGGTLTLNGVTFSGNGVDVDMFGGTLVENDTFNCSGKKKLIPPSLPLNIVNAANGQTVELDCAQFRGTLLVLSNGDRVLYPCSLKEQGKVESVGEDNLPGPLPDGNTFASSFSAHLFKGGTEQTAVDPSITVSFSIPEGANTSGLAILFWDGEKWVEVKNAYVSEDGHFEAQAGSMGTYALVTK